MRKLILSICFFSFVFIASAQITSTTGKFYNSYQGVDFVVVFNGITPSSDLTFTGTGSSINWYKFSNPTNSISNQSLISPEDATGYILNVDGKTTKIWVIDYSKFLTAADYSIEPENNPTAQCNQVNLLIKAPSINYQTQDGINHLIPRYFNVKYTTKKWSGSIWADTIKTIPLTSTLPSVPAPYCNTTFTIVDDQFNIPIEVSSKSTYNTNAVICKVTSNVTVRDSTNEADRPSKPIQLDGSAPLDIQFLSNGNEPVAQFYNWGIFKGNELIINRKDRDHRYTFTQAGTYRVKVTASNSICSYSDSLTVTVSESQIQVPNVFTPNGDGFNDEFRIAYKSIVSFQCWVYNRWGRQVYMWTDPTKGWDGKINGVDATPGPYFYVIKAYGSDYDPKSTPNATTHRRIGEYLLKGDINLLRGVK